MSLPCLPTIVFVALPMPCLSSLPLPVLRLSAVCLFVTMPTPVRPFLCVFAYVLMPVPRLPAACYGGHTKLHGMPVVMARESMFGADAATMARPMPMPTPLVPMPMCFSCLPPSHTHKGTERNAERSAKSNPKSSQGPLVGTQGCPRWDASCQKEQSSSAYAHMHMPVPCLPAVVFVACDYFLRLCRFCVCQQCVCL